MAENGLSILFVDAYDSFTQNIIALLHQIRNTRITSTRIDDRIEKQYGLPLEQFLAQFDAVVLGPGPGDPRNEADTGLLEPIIQCATQLNLPVLGICLGFQVLCLHFGLLVERLPLPCHGHVKHIVPIRQAQATTWIDEIFHELNIDNIRATCYNSLGVRADVDLSINSRPGSSSANSAFSVSSLSDRSASPKTFRDLNSHLRIIGRDTDGYAMIVSHNILPLWGVQFHPESCKSNLSCQKMLRNWLEHVQRTRRSQGNRMLSEQPSVGSSMARRQSASRCFQQSSAFKKTAERLSCITQSTGNLVQWRKLSLKCSRHRISELVNRLSDRTEIAMLESTKKGRFSIYALPNLTLCGSGRPSPDVSSDVNHLRLSFNHSTVSIETGSGDNRVMTSEFLNREDFMEVLEQFMISKRVTGGPLDVPFWGGFIGCLSYENGLEQLGLSVKENHEQINDVDFLWVERSLVYDASTSTAYVQTIRKDDDRYLDAIAEQLEIISSESEPANSSPSRTLLKASPHLTRKLTTIYSLPNRAEYDKQFEMCQQALHAGESYELCLTTEAQVTFTIAQADREHYLYRLYRNLQDHNPVPFAAYLNFPSVTILSSSPEQYMSWSRDGIIDMIPMKGTVKRTPEMTLDRAAVILSSPKEQAENLMIADLIRHDLYSTVGATSNVEVMKLCEVVEHETVYQLVSHIRAHSPIPRSLSPDLKQQHSIHYGLAALRTTLPPGSMTGAPKKRSCEILQSLENRDRGVYSGVLGYLDLGGGGCFSVCIRTAFRRKQAQKPANKTELDEPEYFTDTWRIGAGGAITVLSDKEAEWEEMNTKLHSVLKGFRID